MKFKLAAAASTALLCTALPSMGFVKVETKSTLNKDGSAKFSAVMEIDVSGPLTLIGQAGAANPIGDGKDILVGMMKGLNGYVDVWSDAKAELTKSKTTRISVSGFTKNWRAMADVKKVIGSLPEGNAIPLGEFPEIKLMDMKDDSAGNTVITMAGLDDLGQVIDAGRKFAIKEGKQPKPEDVKLDKADIEKGLQQGRDLWANFKGFAAPLVKTISITSEIEVSGTITESAVFKKTGENRATFTFNGDHILGLIDQVLNDEELAGKIIDLANAVQQNFDNEKSTAAIKSFIEPYLKGIYGGSANPKIVFKPGADAFDYAAETEKAKATQSDELKAILEQVGKSGKVKLPGSATPPGKKKAA